MVHLAGAVLAVQRDERTEGRRYLGLDVLTRPQAIEATDTVDEEVTEPELPVLTA